MPASASTVQHALGCACGAMDLNAACSGFVYGLVAADGLLGAGMERVLLVGAETLSGIVDWDDRNTAVLFGDGAGAVVLERRRRARPRCSAGTSAPTARCRHILHADVGGTIEMDGPEVFRRAVRVMVDSAQRALPAPASAPTTSRCSSPTRPTAGSSTSACSKLGIGAGPHGRHPRQHRQHLGGLDPARPGGRRGRRAGSSPGDLVLLVGFGAA